MRRLDSLPEPPLYRIEVVEDRSPPGGGFLRRLSRVLRWVDQGGRVSQSFQYDEVDRHSLDAVIIVPYFEEIAADGASRVWVVLRSAIRPPCALRDPGRSPISEPVNRGLWEVPAGLVEENERSEQGLRRAAARELHEEAGFLVEPEQLHPLGPSSFPCPAVIAERHFFFRVVVDPAQQETPQLDGSPLEEAGELVAVELQAALAAASSGQLADAKTELSLRRLHLALQAEELSR